MSNHSAISVLLLHCPDEKTNTEGSRSLTAAAMKALSRAQCQQQPLIPTCETLYDTTGFCGIDITSPPLDVCIMGNDHTTRSDRRFYRKRLSPRRRRRSCTLQRIDLLVPGSSCCGHLVLLLRGLMWSFGTTRACLLTRCPKLHPIDCERVGAEYGE
eukprot:scaffold4353_cov133-Amphora_coffeaeformis.AAC.2